MRVISSRPRTNDETGEEGQGQDASPDLQYLELKFQLRTLAGNVPKRESGCWLGLRPREAAALLSRCWGMELRALGHGSPTTERGAPPGEKVGAGEVCLQERTEFRNRTHS